MKKASIVIIKTVFVVLLSFIFFACLSDQQNTSIATMAQSAPPSVSARSSAIAIATTPFSNSAYRSISSPLGDWIVYVHSPTDRDSPIFTTRIVSTSGTAEWVLNYVTSQFEEETYYFPFYWTQDGKYLYLTVYRAMDGCGKVLEFYHGSGLFRLDLQTGDLNEVISEEPSGSYAFSISPDDTSLIYAEQAEKPITIRVKSLVSEQASSVTLDEQYDGVGNFAWTPNEDTVLFIATENVCESDQNYAPMTLNLSTLELKIFVEAFDRNLRVVEWESPDLVRMSDQQGNIWILDLKLSRLVSATSTP